MKDLNLILNLDKNGKIFISDNIDESLTWDITLIDNEITIFSNGYYLSYDEKKKEIQNYKYMIRWHFEKENDFYIIKPILNNNTLLMLSITNNEAILTDNKNNSFFEFIDKELY